ncbi:glycosyl hydrolase family 16 [Flagellimonas sp. HMM57]|uniref:glycosyl hydrolase family 16 n=1 Tax=Flagellimonas sp. HSM57 TaxID=2654675 RepID=UPI001F0A657B|nr:MULTISPECIES: glycosyl hydrolase family 16 [unclassified Flagellimonas]UII76801.1 glycosyl hydrolase family 16 [Flagellimonas sp. HMM57]
MKNIRNIHLRFTLLLSLGIAVFSSCERDFSDDVKFAAFSNNGDIFTDEPVGLTDEFFDSFDPNEGANPEGFGTDDNVAFMGTSSIRIDVPAPDDPDGGFIGGIFLDRGDGRDLTGFDALTFYVKGSITATIGEVGFGTDFEENKFAVIAQNIRLSTDWRKVIIPIPDPSKLIQERGMFFFSAGTQTTNGFGYTFWIDELRFEKLGTIAQPSPTIFFGQDISTPAVNGIEFVITGISQTFNLASGINQTVSAAPAYFDFSSSDNSVAIVNESGEIVVVGSGNSSITAQLANVRASGSLDITSNGVLPTAPLPMELAENVSAIFSNEYANAVESIFEPNFGGSTTNLQLLSNDDEDALVYTNNNFTGIVFSNTLDGTSRTTLHIDVYPFDESTAVDVQIRDVGANQVLETNTTTGLPDGDDVDRRFLIEGLTPGQWTSIEIPLDGNLAAQRNNLGALILAGGPNFIFDNIYFFTE